MNKMTLKERAKRERRFRGKHVNFTIKEIMDMAAEGNLVPSLIQRNYVTKMSSEIIANIFIGIGIGTITMNKTNRKKNGKPIYEVIDGWQRICSMIIFFTGISKSAKDCSFTNKGILAFAEKYNLDTYKRAMVFLLKDDISWLSKEEQEYFKSFNRKTFKTIKEMEGDIEKVILNDNIDVKLVSNLTLQEQLVLFIAMNKGVTPLKKMEIYKGTVPVDVWDKLNAFGKSLNVAGAKRYTREALVGHLFAIFCGAYDNQQTWMDAFIEVAAVTPTKNKKKWDKDFAKFEIMFEKFKKSNLFALSSKTIQIKDGSATVKSTTEEKINLLQIKLFFAMFCEKQKELSDPYTNSKKFTDFVDGLNKNMADATAWHESKTNATGYIKTFNRVYPIIKKYFFDEGAEEELMLAALTEEE